RASRAIVSSRWDSPESLTPSRRISQGSVVAGINRVARITTYVKKISSCRNGNSAPDGRRRGMDNAAARETIPRIPTQLRIVTRLQRGFACFLDRESLPARYDAGTIQINRTAITTRTTMEPKRIRCLQEYCCRPLITAGI